MKSIAVKREEMVAEKEVICWPNVSWEVPVIDQDIDDVPDVVSYNHLMNAFSLSQVLTKAIAVFEQISQNGLSSDLVSYSTLIKACVWNNKLDAAFKLY